MLEVSKVHTGLSIQRNVTHVKGVESNSIILSGTDLGGPVAQAPLTLGFEAPKLSIFGPYLFFP